MCPLGVNICTLGLSMTDLTKKNDIYFMLPLGKFFLYQKLKTLNTDTDTELKTAKIFKIG